ncbi:MAG: hypothetical protein ABSE05_09665 [Syntrophales bacterium]|jgi:hypothetical protein
MEDLSPLNRLLENGKFRFERLLLNDIDNLPVIKINAPDIVDQEICLFHRDVPTGDDYFRILHLAISHGLSERRSTPVVRFADGEYAFYEYDLSCNGLYQQAESVRAIREAMSSHTDALRILASSGMLAPLIFPGNITGETKKLFKLFHRSKEAPSAFTFLKFLFQNGIDLTSENYVPFYVVYAYLTSEDFIRLVDGKRVCILNAEFNGDSCTDWFARFSSQPDLSFVETPAEYVATRWKSMKEDILKQISPETDLCIVGAGIGSLPVCVDVAMRFSIPAIDAGHVLNMMNGRVDKSNGARLYTIRKTKNTG